MITISHRMEGCKLVLVALCLSGVFPGLLQGEVCNAPLLKQCICMEDGAGRLFLRCAKMPAPKLRHPLTMNTEHIFLRYLQKEEVKYDVRIWPRLQMIYGKNGEELPCNSGTCTKIKPKLSTPVLAIPYHTPKIEVGTIDISSGSHNLVIPITSAETTTYNTGIMNQNNIKIPSTNGNTASNTPTDASFISDNVPIISSIQPTDGINSDSSQNMSVSTSIQTSTYIGITLDGSTLLISGVTDTSLPTAKLNTVHEELLYKIGFYLFLGTLMIIIIISLICFCHKNKQKIFQRLKRHNRSSIYRARSQKTQDGIEMKQI